MVRTYQYIKIYKIRFLNSTVCMFNIAARNAGSQPAPRNPGFPPLVQSFFRQVSLVQLHPLSDTWNFVDTGFPLQIDVLVTNAKPILLVDEVCFLSPLSFFYRLSKTLRNSSITLGCLCEVSQLHCVSGKAEKTPPTPPGISTVLHGPHLKKNYHLSLCRSLQHLFFFGRQPA